MKFEPKSCLFQILLFFVSFCGLPWLIEANQNNGVEWTGEIYCTKPTVEFARIYLTELRNYCDDIENECKEAKLENASSSATSFGQGSKCVTQNQINSCLEKGGFLKARFNQPFFTIHNWRKYY
jgi:hypothetical protein